MKSYLIRLLDYEQWANQAVIDALVRVENPPERAVRVMGHILSAQQIWLSRLTGEVSNVAVWEDIPMARMSETSNRNSQRLKTFLEAEPAEGLNRIISYKTTSGQPFTNPLIDILMHMSHHAAYHRGQVVQLIRPQLADVPMTDFIFWARG
ncbi:putative damage-inducible protein DinB [Larkinella arboricola]|uniref:Putative damage-inducible protein DinB n=1 Tax=Larkinella arboricola TaxID=643671 RepID=A0A327X940_LARAB|nr:DinB family protein [Larkinella arboricola]RAK02778.1 putative damage-inducible protein DinB [Larkinella arboricola]